MGYEGVGGVKSKSEIKTGARFVEIRSSLVLEPEFGFKQGTSKDNAN